MKIRRYFHLLCLFICLAVFVCTGWFVRKRYDRSSLPVRGIVRSPLCPSPALHQQKEEIDAQTEAHLNEYDTNLTNNKTSQEFQRSDFSQHKQQVEADFSPVLQEFKTMSLENASLPTAEEIQIKRQLILDETCNRLQQDRNLPQINWNSTVHFIISNKHRFMFCFAPKVACTSWKGIMKTLFQNETNGKTRGKRFIKMNDIMRSPSAIRNRWLKYRKVMFAREPLNRALSAYLDKFVHGSEKPSWEQRFGTIIVKQYRNYSLQQLKQRPFNITFTEFVRYLIDTGPKVKMNQRTDHWLPISSFTYPCQIKYDFIGKYETLAHDGPYVMKKFGLDQVVSFPEIHGSHAIDSMREAYAEVPEELIRKLQSYYSLDYELFGYSKREVLDAILPSKIN